jgi:hypothetical protein
LTDFESTTSPLKRLGTELKHGIAMTKPRLVWNNVLLSTELKHFIALTNPYWNILLRPSNIQPDPSITKFLHSSELNSGISLNFSWCKQGNRSTVLVSALLPSSSSNAVISLEMGEMGVGGGGWGGLGGG